MFSADGDLCKSCQQAYAPVLGTTTGAEPSNDSPAAAGQNAPVVETMAEVAQVALPPPVAKVDPVKIAAAAEAAKAETARAVADLTAKAHLARAKNPPAVVARRPIVSDLSPLPQRRSRTMLITAAAVIVVVIGAAESARRLGLLSPQQAARDEGQRVQATPAVKIVDSAVNIVAENRAPVIPVAQAQVVPLPTPTPAPTLKPTAAPTLKPAPKLKSTPKPKAAAVRRPPVRQADSPNQRVVPVVAPAPPPVTSAPVPTTPPALVAVTSPRASAPPVGRLFERKDVDEPPQVATRVAPKLPGNVPARLRNSTVVVRVLVSRTGHPSRVSLLRGSILGRSSDDAVVAAVTQWTFSPAKKQGEAVNCWLNVGVPLAQAN